MKFHESSLRAELSLKQYRCPVRLGWTKEERLHPQWVAFDLRLSFPSPPAACVTDQLEDTLCYAEIASILESTCQRSEYRLIEKLGFDAFSAIKEQLPSEILLSLRLRKEKTPIENLTGGSSFSLSDPPLRED